MPTLTAVTRLCTMSETKRLPIDIEGSSDEEHGRRELCNTRSRKEEEMARQCASDFALAKVCEPTSLSGCLKIMHAPDP